MVEYCFAVKVEIVFNLIDLKVEIDKAEMSEQEMKVVSDYSFSVE